MRRIFASSDGRLSCGALSRVSHLYSCVSSSSGSAHSPATSTTDVLRMATRFQSRGRVTNMGAHVDAHIMAATTMATPSSFALISAFGVAHDVMVGQIGDDAVIQFTLVSHVIDPVEAEQQYLQINAPPSLETNENNNGSGGSSSSSSVGRVSDSPSRGLRSVGGNNRATVGNSNGSNNTSLSGSTSSNSKSTLRQQQQRSPAVDDDHNPFSKLEAEKAYSIAKQQHLYQSSAKEQFTVRCFGGEDELLALQSRISNGDFVKVEGNLKANKQKDFAASSGPSLRGRSSSAPAASTSQQSGISGGPFPSSGERCFPYIRVELGDEEILKAASRHLAITEAAPRDAPRRLSRMGPLKGAHALVKSGNVTIVSRTHPTPSTSR